MDFSRLTFLLQSARFLFLLSYIVIISGCDSGKNIQEVEIVSSPEEINLKAEDQLNRSV